MSLWLKGLEYDQLGGIRQTSSYAALYLPYLTTLGTRLGEASLLDNTLCVLLSIRAWIIRCSLVVPLVKLQHLIQFYNLCVFIGTLSQSVTTDVFVFSTLNSFTIQ